MRGGHRVRDCSWVRAVGYGTGVSDRGVGFYYEWVRDHVGRWEYPRHVPAT